MATDWLSHFASRTRRMEASAIRELLKLTSRPEVISFAGGLPATETLPAQGVADACAKILATKSAIALQYAPTEGYPPLCEQIAAMYRARGVPATADNVLITTGSQQGLDLVGRTFIDENDDVVVETPTYIGALQAWRPCAPHFVGVPIDEDGMKIEQADLSARTKLLYLLPNFQNPAGVSLSASRRECAVLLAHQHGFVIIEDDPYRWLRYSGEDMPALVEIEAAQLGSRWDTDGRVIHLGTFSKILAPGLRIGWILAPSPALKMIVLAKQGADLHSSTLTQMIAEELLRDGTIDNNMPRLQAIYRERRDTMLDALDKSIGATGTWTHPKGGLFIWVTIHGEIDTPSLMTDALARNVAFVPGDSFYFDGRGSDSMRLNFSCMPPDRIYEGMRRLGALIAEKQSHVAIP